MPVMDISSNPGFPFRILSRSFGKKSELRDKIRCQIKGMSDYIPGLNDSLVTGPQGWSDSPGGRVTH